MDTQRNLLLGLFALQLGLITSQQLAAALQAWIKDKTKSLDTILREQGALAADQQPLVQAMAREHLAKHKDRPGQSLAAITVDEPLRELLEQIADVNLKSAVSQLSRTAADLSVATINPHDAASHPATPNGPQGTPPRLEETISLNVDQESPLPSAVRAGLLRFRILRPHAKGGLGEVFLAQDQELNREVALKEIQARYAGHRDSRSRFMLEAEVTGGLEHPGIVPVYGLGNYPDGRPYYAMRFIKGDTFKEAIRQFHAADWTQQATGARALELRQLLRRFIDVCNAIEYAHSRGVLHRDLKPANIMLGKYGETLVVDWGLAKTLGRPEPAGGFKERQLEPVSSSAMAGTQMGTAVGTPSYMSPEQAQGDLEHLGPSSDVYSLGATLYELLTGHAPFEDHNIAKILEQVKRGTFPLPRQIERQVPKPLEAICLRAMAREPSDRYHSAFALANDVEHWLADEATSAYREPWRERLTRWARRHKTWAQAAAASIVIVAIIAVLASMLINNSRRNEAIARRSAEESFLQARHTVDDFFTRISESKLLNVPSLQPLRGDLLNAALQYYQGFIAQRERDPSVRRELAETYYRVGLIESEIGGKAAALASLENAEAAQRSLKTEGDHSPELALDLANTCNAIGNIKQQMGDLNAALARFQEAKTQRESLVRARPRDAQLRRKLANSHNNIAVVQARLGEKTEAAKEFELAGAQRAQLAIENPTSVVFLRDLAQGLFNFALYQKDTDNLTGALESYRQAIATYESLVRMDPQVIDHRRELAWTCRALGDLQAEIGRSSEALESYQRAQEIAEKLARQNPSLLELQADVASIYASLGRLKRQTAELPKAVEYYGRACDIRQQLVAIDPNVERFQRDLASCQLHLGMAQLDVDALPDALGTFDFALENYRALAQKNPDDETIQDALAQTHRNIGLVYRASGDQVRALEAFQETLKIFERLGSDKSAPVAFKAGWADALVNIAVDRRALGQADEALAAARRAVEIQAHVVSELPEVAEYQYMRAEGLTTLGLLQLQLGEYHQALDSFQSVVAIVSKISDEQPDDLKYRSLLGTALDKQAIVLWLLDKRGEAIESARHATVSLLFSFEQAPSTVQYRLNLSDNYFNRAKFDRESGQPAEAVVLTLERKKLWPDDAGELYKAACELALSAKAASDLAGDKPSAAQQAQQNNFANLAVETLKEAVAAGLQDVRTAGTDSRLEILHTHPEFKQLMKAIDKDRQ